MSVRKEERPFAGEVKSIYIDKETRYDATKIQERPFAGEVKSIYYFDRETRDDATKIQERPFAGEVKSIYIDKETRDDATKIPFCEKASYEVDKFKTEKGRKRTCKTETDKNVNQTHKNQIEDNGKQGFSGTITSNDRQGEPQNLLRPTEFVTEHNQIKVKITKADITIQRVDAIVNAANERLRHWGGVAKAIAEKAGPELERDCSNFTRDGSLIPVTGLFVSSGGKLPAKFVIHAVGPIWEMYGEDRKKECARDLRYTVFRCLLEANRRSFKSIAIPSIGAGELGFFFQQKILPEFLKLLKQ
ncbi:O-acetyl-ADP-ribose deacetylase [Elysia marginata]|uniref:O-acetyl-ADP-ribose deacetylase n=1 Tax=Elysia marginata TaxID=1093978 RepID=A0AAV4F1I9_9GAST|nr:O-acetyl-ADP-ribose deacetylase [Elysia marginata]